LATAPADIHVDPETLPWVPQGEGIWFKPLRILPQAGTWTNLLRVSPAGMVNRHRHVGDVEAWILQGSWRYVEHDWVGHPGSYIYEPAGDVHTLVVEGGTEMVTLFRLGGPMEYVDETGAVAFVETAESKLERYLSYCRDEGLEPKREIFA
jgi:2,4'-dihydroxyacetophenone dioxygenase